jgi:1,4-dihydroxy-2-naphthoate polyprenyltransferase
MCATKLTANGQGSKVRPTSRFHRFILHPSSLILQVIRLGRPHFLVGGFLLHGLGVAMAVYSGAVVDWGAVLWGQVAITAIQLMTHYSNDYFDVAADRANKTPTPWSGGSRVLVGEVVRPAVALWAALLLTGVALVAIVVLGLVVRPGWATFALLLLALVMAWAYSAPPIQLHSRGVGELSVALLVSGLTPLVGFYLQNGRLARLPLLAVLPLACLQFAMLLAIEFPDAAGDAAVGKRTLVVRWGASWAARLYILVLGAVYGLLPLLVAAGLPLLAAGAVCLPLPLAVWQGWRVWRGTWREPAQWSSLAFVSIALLMGTTAAELAAFVWLIWY